jgi:hypothetical protein
MLGSPEFLQTACRLKYRLCSAYWANEADLFNNVLTETEGIGIVNE